MAINHQTQSTTKSMQASLSNAYGGPEVVETTEVSLPSIGADEVLVEVHAAGLDRGVVHLLQGNPYVIRLGFGLKRPKNPIMGFDVSGVVVEVGAGVTRFEPGDEVFGVAKGSFAQYAAALESKLAKRPTKLSHVETAVIPISGLTALQATRDIAKVEPGERVGIFGASGGVGSYAIQTAKDAGGIVTAVASAPKEDFVRSLGADHFVDYESEEINQLDKQFDVILFIAGTQNVRELRSMLTKKGRLVVIGGEDGGKILGIGRQIRALMMSPFVSQKLTMFLSKESHVDIETLAKMVDEGTLHPKVSATYPLSEVAAAITDLNDRRVTGKIGIKIR